MKKLIVVIDDSKIILNFMKTLITDEGHDCILFRNPLEAIRHIPALDPDVVITDYLMFDMDGLQVIDELRLKKVTCPIVIFTSIVDTCMEKRCIELGVPIFYKPVDRQKIKQMTSH